jgi:hypothetical protein
MRLAPVGRHSVEETSCKFKSPSVLEPKPALLAILVVEPVHPAKEHNSALGSSPIRLGCAEASAGSRLGLRA